MERLRGGDRANFTELVGRHGGALLRLATTLVRNRSVAEEVVQDAWLAALDSGPCESRWSAKGGRTA